MKGMITMKMRNLLKPGDFVTLVPAGIHITLQYNAEGNLEKVYTGFQSDRVDCSNDLRTLLVQNHTVPGTVHIKRGTSWVRGVLYTNAVQNAPGKLPACIQQSLMKLYHSNPSQFNFFAATFESTMTDFKGATPTRHALSMSKFKLLPGWLVPGNVTDNLTETWINSPQFTFNKIVTDYIIFHRGEVNYLSANSSQFIVNKVVRYTDDNGYVKGRIYQDVKSPINVDYSDIVRFDIQPNTLVVLDSENQIMLTKPTDNKKRDKRSRTITCKYCGKSYQSPLFGTVQCPDTHCVSKMLPNIRQFLSKLNLTVPSNDDIHKWLEEKTILCIPDILLLPDYQHLQIEVSLSSLLRAIVPISAIPRDDIFVLFANACTNNVRTMRYYVTNPALITADLGLNHADLPKLLNWFNDNCNASDVQSLLDAPQFIFKDKDKRFDGPPIFRNKVIFLTGDFIRGNFAEISAILQSYSARVTLQFSDDVHCVLIGGKHENIDGRAINAAHNLGISVMQEEDFFKYYQIDEDLKANLVYKQ